jgi:hypothetical protein
VTVTKAEDQAVRIQRQRVHKHLVKVSGAQQLFEVVQADPGARPKPVENVVLLKSDQNPVHRTVLKDQIVEDAGKEQRI